MEVTFGAVGDFISIAALIKDLIDLLDDSRGSAWEYQSLRQQLSFLKQSLDGAKVQYHELRGVAEFRDVCDALEAVVDEAERRLEGIAVKLQKYTATLAEGSTKRTIKKVARKVQWSMEHKETEKFLVDLNRYVNIIQSLQFDIFRRLMQRNFDSTKHIHTDTQDLLKHLQNVNTRMATIEDELRAVRTTTKHSQQYLLAVSVIVTQRLDNVTQAVSTLGTAALQGASGIRWLGTVVLGQLANIHSIVMGRIERPTHMGAFFTFDDYMGVESIILLDFVDSWSAFEGSIHGKYKGRKGGRRVSQNRFLLQNRQTGQELDRDAHWSVAVVPGSRVDMSLICEVEEDEDEAESLKCPFCGATCEVVGVIIQCTSCQDFRQLPGLSTEEAAPFAPDAPGSSHRDAAQGPANEAAEASGSSKKRRERPFEKKRAKRTRKSSDSHSGSDSDETDLTGIKRVAILPIFRLPLRPSPNQPDPDPDPDPIPEAELEELKIEQSAADDNRADQEATSEDDYEIFEVNGQAYVLPGRSRIQKSSDSKTTADESQLATSSRPNTRPSYRTPARPGATSPRYNSSGYYYTKPDISKPIRAHSGVRSGQDYFNPDDDEALYNTGYYSPSPGNRRTRRGASPSYNAKQSSTKPIKSSARPKPVIPLATAEDAKKHGIPAGYSLKNWDPREEPILLLGSVFDANMLGKWIYDWTVYVHGPATIIADIAGDLWLLLIRLYDKRKRAEEALPRIRNDESRELTEEFTLSAVRLADKLKFLLKRCEAPMLKAAKRQRRPKTASSDLVEETKRVTEKTEETDEEGQGLGKNAGAQFIRTIFGKDGEFDRTEKFMQNVRLWILRFDANLDEILKNPEA
ncbi:hypothetical protein B0I35DRAFT_434083 [Stachybotrys elegans]|uniref:Ubiquitin-like domain-containing protein n=1 Tax=Stachybotrys elegans TaxID=80388 RepID=A0A8K0WQH4_9HYPO|nr:hypothetical protein B0I35DRAFT_434083 [Stachybotrys elegans]